jgi:iron complex outermembrane receptor protein
MTSRSTLRRLLVALGTAAPGLAAAQQQPPATSIPPVSVVATRIPEAPHDVAASIEIITGSDLRARNVKTLAEALTLSTGVAIAPGGDAGPASAVPEFQGLREFDAFLLVVDGVPWGGAFNPAIGTLSLRDVERIEVLRGPAPVTYGATSFVGVIHVVHTAAAATRKYASIDGGSYGSMSAGVELPLLPDAAWKSRVSADFDRQAFADDRASYSRGHGLFRTSKVNGEDRTWLMADLNILRQEPNSPHPREGSSLSPNVPLDANHNPAGAYMDENRIAVQGGFERGVFSGARWGTMASFTHSAQDMFRGFLVDVSDTPDNASGFKETIDVNDLYADTHVIWPERSGVRFMAGADLLMAAGEGKGAVFTYTVPLNGSTATAVSEPTTLDRDAESERRFIGAYTSAEWRPTTRFTLSAGLRLNATTEKRGEGEEVTHTRPAGSIGALVSLWEQGTDHFRAFANYRDTFKPAAFDFSLAENEGVLEPETARTYEVGFKSRMLDARMDAELSVFRTDFNNLVTSTIVGGLPAMINAGQTRFQGAEISTDLRLVSDVSARASYSFHDAKFVDFVQAFGGTPTQLAGKRFEMSARHLASAGLTLAPERGFLAYGNVNYTGDRQMTKRNTALAPAFTTIDAGIGYRLERVELRLDGRNLTDRRDAVSESEMGDAQYYRMTPQQIRAGLAFRF